MFVVAARLSPMPSAERDAQPANGHRAGAATLLDIPRSTLYYKLKEYGIGDGRARQ
jgi:transcriptional regulator of acetoin/glycerol metabolism